MTVTARVVGAKAVAAGFNNMSRTAPAKARRVVRHYGLLLQTKVKGNASGRPGPNAPTGDYRRSIGLRTYGSGTMAIAEVGTNSAQGRRLELGFVGVDSLGRQYNQPPYPHFGPAVEAIEPAFTQAVADELTERA